MNEIIRLMPALGVSILVNIALGMYYKIGTSKLNFEYKVLINGVVKALIIGGSFIGLAYCFDAVDLSSLGFTPQLMMGIAVSTYVVKGANNLAKILGIEIIKK